MRCFLNGEIGISLFLLCLVYYYSLLFFLFENEGCGGGYIGDFMFYFMVFLESENFFVLVFVFLVWFFLFLWVCYGVYMKFWLFINLWYFYVYLFDWSFKKFG